jgi:hypothetical protein
MNWATEMPKTVYFKSASGMTRSTQVFSIEMMKSWNLGQRLGGNQPDLSGVRVIDAQQLDVGFLPPDFERADSLPIEREPIIQRTLR